jgi:predicted PhzF superfamily epimerase YddE/YHI9
MKLDLRGVIITAQSDRWDFVARFFAPKYGIFEDPVTGSAYTQLAPYWTSRLGMKRFQVRQMSPRGGELACELSDDRVVLCGKAITYLEGKIHV